MLDLAPEYVQMVRAIVATHVGNRRVLVFGSRVTEHARRFSDVDLALDGPEPSSLLELSALKEALAESDLPYMVDVVDLATADSAFRDEVMARHEVLWPPMVPPCASVRGSSS